MELSELTSETPVQAHFHPSTHSPLAAVVLQGLFYKTVYNSYMQY